MITNDSIFTKSFQQQKQQPNKRKRDDEDRLDESDTSINLCITIDFNKIKRVRKENKRLSKSLYIESLPYDNSALPDVRFPTHHSVPEHLLDEMRYMFPVTQKERKGKIGLIPDESLGGRAIGLLQWLVFTHWRDTKNLDNLTKIILHRKSITLSQLDWLCTNYSKTYDVKYPLDPSNPVNFSIHESYNQRLQLHLRAFFDAFARSKRILIEWVTQDDDLFNSFVKDKDLDSLDIKWDNKKIIGMRRVQGKNMIYFITSPGQLNFFAWAQENRVVDYCSTHIDYITQHMSEAQELPAPVNGKRRRLSASPTTGCKAYRVQTCVRYEGRFHTMVTTDVASMVE